MSLDQIFTVSDIAQAHDSSETRIRCWLRGHEGTPYVRRVGSTLVTDVEGLELMLDDFHEADFQANSSVEEEEEDELEDELEAELEDEEDDDDEFS